MSKGPKNHNAALNEDLAKYDRNEIRAVRLSYQNFGCKNDILDLYPPTNNIQRCLFYQIDTLLYHQQSIKDEQ